MKRNIKLTIEYDGTNYHGWQEQKNVITIQKLIKDSIYKVTKENVTVYGAGRTDAGVHARGQVANFYTHSNIPDSNFANAINSHMPSDVIVLNSRNVELDFHSQFSAKGKCYSYQIISRASQPAIYRNYYHWVWYPLEVSLMREAAEILVGKHDFSSFQAANSPRKSNVRTVNYIDIAKENCYIKFFIDADGFLYHMVRNIVGTLILVGRKQLTPEAIREILVAKDRNLAGPTAPAKALFLEYVKY